MSDSQHDADRSTDSGRLGRRGVLAAGGALALAGCTGGDGGGTPPVERETVVKERTVVRERTVVKTPAEEDLIDLHALLTEGEIQTMMWLYGINNGAWRRHGIDLSMEVAPFAKKSRQVTAGLSKVSGGISFPAIMKFLEQDEDLVIYGNQLNFTNQMIALPGHGIEDMGSDLADKRLGVPFETSTTTNAHRAIILNEFDFDILEDTAETRSAAPPILWNLMQDGELDAVIQFDAFTIQANATDDVETVFDPFEFWTADNPYPAPMTAWVAYRDWLQENAGTALDFLAGFESAMEMANENIDEVIRNYGRLSSVTSEAEGEVVREWMAEDKIFAPYTFEPDYIENNWKFVEMLHEAEAFDALPDHEDVVVPRGQLEDWAAE